MARPSYLLNHNPITNLVCITYGYGKYTIIIIIIIIAHGLYQEVKQVFKTHTAAHELYTVC